MLLGASLQMASLCLLDIARQGKTVDGRHTVRACENECT